MWQMLGKSSNVGKPFDQIFLLFFNSLIEREYKYQINLPKTILPNQQSTAALSQQWSKKLQNVLQAAWSTVDKFDLLRGSMSVQNRLIKPVKEERKPCCKFCSQSWSQFGQLIPNSSKTMPINVVSKNYIFAHKNEVNASQKNHGQWWSNLLCFPKIFG